MLQLLIPHGIVDCGGKFILANATEEVLLTSPNFPKHYQNHSRCIWTIHAPKGNHICVQFAFIKLEQKYDWLKVCDGSLCSKETQLTELSGN